MELPIPKSVKNVWELWEIRSFILFSMFLQCFLIVVSPLRKRVANIWLYMSIWSAYLLADWVAGFTVGLISSSQSNLSCNVKKGNINPDIFAFWVSFLLVHLGGPDTITAFALEDNELWRRHMLTLIFQFVSALYVFYQTLPHNPLWMPTMFMFISGIIKYGERTYSLFLASIDTFRDKSLREPDAGPNYAKLMNEYHAMKEANLPTSIKMFSEPSEVKTVNRVKTENLDRKEVVLYAHKFFEKFKGLIVDIILSFRERNQCRDFFLKRSPEDAFDVVEAELNFMYDILFTKLPVVYNKCSYTIRFICSSLAITSLGLFYFESKTNFKRSDVAITYTLLLGAISLDVIAFIFLMCSDWLKVSISKLPPVNIEQDPEIPTTDGSKMPDFRSFFRRVCPLLCRRWSQSVSSYNLIYYSRHRRYEWFEKFLSLIGLTYFLDGMQYVKRKPFTEVLKEHIFEELKKKSSIADDLETAKELSAAKGDWALQAEDCNDLVKYVLSVDYDQSLLLWHIATDLCYYDKENPQDVGNETKNYRMISKHLSDYMLYLLVMQPTMVSAVAGIGQIRFRDTCAEAEKFFRDQRKKNRGEEKGDHGQCCCNAKRLRRLQEHSCTCNMLGYCSRKKKRVEEEEEEDHKRCCNDILEVPTEVKPGTVKGEKSKSVLFDGSILAKELQKKGEKKWKIMSNVWVEMLSYAAINCRAHTHAQQLPRGGELLTVVWLLMVQFGLGTQFQIDEGHARAKLTVGK